MTDSVTFTRRRFAGLVGTGALALTTGAALKPAPASASISWCRSDPLVTVNGKTGHVYVDSTEAMLASATGPIQVEIQVPVGSIRSAVPLDNGFGWGYAITFREDARLAKRGSYSEVRVEVTAPARDGTLPVRVTFHADDPGLADSRKDGVANQPILTGAVKI